MFLKVNQSYHVVVTLASLRPSYMEAKARTVASRMVWVNGHGCQRAYFYWYYAAVAEMLVALRSPRPGRPDVDYVHLCLF